LSLTSKYDFHIQLYPSKFQVTSCYENCRR
jgi:hypothetical protein